MIDYGPLAVLIGNWQGREGIDIAPEPDGVENNPYYETINFEACGDVTNAEQQRLVVLRYLQIVRKTSSGEVFHDQTGYWMWEPATGLVMQSLTIPRGVSLTAGGKVTTDSNGNTTFNVKAAADSVDWGIVQPPFMMQKAKTVSFNHQLTVNESTLNYSETTMLDIYGKPFEHTDGNQLIKVV